MEQRASCRWPNKHEPKTRQKAAQAPPLLVRLRLSPAQAQLAPSKSHDRIAAELGYDNAAAAGFGAMGVGDMILKGDLFNKASGMNEPIVIPAKGVRFVDTPLYDVFRQKYGQG